MHDGRVGLWCAIALFIGCCAGLALPCAAPFDALLDAACGAGVVMAALVWCLRGHRWVALVLALLMCALLGVIRAGHEVMRTDHDDAVGMLRDEPVLVRFQATLLESPAPPDHANRDVLDGFQASADEPRLQADATLVHLHDGTSIVPATGHVSLMMPGLTSDLHTGEVVEGIGWLMPATTAANPGERDPRVGAWQRGWVGRLLLESQPTRVMAAPWLMRVRSWLQSCADRNLLRSLGDSTGSPVATLVVAMTTGRQLPGYATLRQTFSATGLSHFLAISGFNVAVLFGVCGVCLEALRVPWWLRGWCLILTGVLFLTVVDVEVSVLRAGVAGVMAGTSLTFGRGWRGNGVLATAAIGTLLVDPWSARNVGFQLSYGAVLALRYGSDPVDRCLAICWPKRWTLQDGWVLVWMRGLRLAFAASLAASLMSTPITLLSFGSISPWCAVASTMLGPLAALLTVIASIVVVIGWIPFIGPMLGWPLWCLGWLFLQAVLWVGTWPLCMVMLLPPTSGPVCAPPDPSVLEWVALAIGDGSVHVIRCGGKVVVFDAGSISRAGAGSSVVVPALRALGVDHIQAIVVSHPHLDHYSAIPEIVQAFPVQRVVVTEAWMRVRDQTSACGFLLSWLAKRDVPVHCMVEGDTIRQGPLIWRSIHPPKGFVPTAVNDGSLGFIIQHEALPERPAVLLLGDAQDQAIARCLARRDILRPWAMELPHHGGWRPIAQALCEWVHADMVLQSTGQRRYARDRFDVVLRETPRGVTCRDGALRFTLDPARQPQPARLERWVGGRWAPVPVW